MIDIELIKLIMTILIAGYIILNFKNIQKKLLKFSRGSVILSFIIMIGYLMITLLYFKYDYLMTLLVALLIFMSLLIVFDVLYNSINNLLEKHTNSNSNTETKNISQINNLIQQDFNVTNINNSNKIDNSKTFNTSQINNHLEQNNNVTNIEIVEHPIKTNNQDIFSFKKLNESEIMELFDSNINNIHEDSKYDFLQLLKGVIPKNKIIWKGTSGKGKTNITYTGIFILLNKILNLPITKLEREDRKKLIEFIIKTFKKYNPDSEKKCNEIAYSTLNTAYTNFSL